MPVGRPPKATYTCTKCEKVVASYQWKAGASICVTCWEASGQKAAHIEQTQMQHQVNEIRKKEYALEQVNSAAGAGGDIRAYFKLKEVLTAKRAAWAATFCVCCKAKSYEPPDTQGHIFCTDCQSMSSIGMCEKHQRMLD